MPIQAITIKGLMELYDKIRHTTKMGFTFSANSVTNVSAGLQAEREGVCKGWRICAVCRIATALWDGGMEA